MAEGVNGVATLFRSKNHKYSVLRGKTGLYQSTCPEFRYGDEKVLGTQPVGRLPLIVFQVLISLKAYLHVILTLSLSLSLSLSLTCI